MKLIVISDSHGNVANLKHVLGFAEKIEGGGIIHCGDWDNLLAVETVLNSAIPVYAVLGNADVGPEISKKLEVKSKKFNDKFLEIKLGGRKIGIIHNIHQLDSLASRQLDVLFTGHTHRQEETIRDGVRVVNPGTLENDIHFAVYDTETNKLDLVKI